MKWTYPHMCRDGHDEIGWRGDGEQCPVCLTIAGKLPGVAAVEQLHRDFATFGSETGTSDYTAIPAARPRNSGQQNGADPLRRESSAPPANPEPQREDSTFAGDTP